MIANLYFHSGPKIITANKGCGMSFFFFFYEDLQSLPFYKTHKSAVLCCEVSQFENDSVILNFFMQICDVDQLQTVSAVLLTFESESRVEEVTCIAIFNM